MIYQTLQEETNARPRRRIEIVNLGLEPWEAADMGLEAEKVTDRERRVAVADYVLAWHDGERWADWLQTNRYELNAMTTPQFLAWLDGKMAEHGGGKVIPPSPVIAAALMRNVAGRVENSIEDRLLKKARIEKPVAAAMGKVTALTASSPAAGGAAVDLEPRRHWTDCVIDFGRELAGVLVS